MQIENSWELRWTCLVIFINLSFETVNLQGLFVGIEYFILVEGLIMSMFDKASITPLKSLS